MKNKQIELNYETPVPKINNLGALGKLLNWIHRIHHIYWLIAVVIGLVLFVKFLPLAKWTFFWSVLKSQSIIIGMLLAFCLIAVSLVWSKGQRIDAMVFMYFNNNTSQLPWLDMLMLGFSQFGNGIVNMIIAFILFLGVQHLLAYELVLGTLTLWLVVELMKVLIHRSRPFNKLINTRIVGLRERGNSFPSGHTSQAFFTATLIIHYFNASFFVVILLYSISLLVGITRIYVGVHYPRDVFAGAILGSVWGLMGVIVNSYIFR